MTKRLHPDDELEGLVRRLNEAAAARAEDGAGADEVGAAARPANRPEPVRAWSLPPSDPDGLAWLERLLATARERYATDLLLVAGAPPVVRIHGALEPLDDGPLSPRSTASLCAALVPPERRAAVEGHGSVDFSIRSAVGPGRFRCNVHRERGRWSASIRVFPADLPDLESLHLPAGLARFAELQYGLVLLTGPTGSGKSTTIAALLRRVLARRRVHLVTIEDPVEYEHEHHGSVVEHVEIGRDAPSFAQALRASLRQNPDVLLIGEMRDPESISIAITAAETGHLVFSTLHTGDAPQTVHRIVDSYPAEQMETVRSQLSISLAGIVSQELLPRVDGRGRVPAVEILVATPAVRNLVRRGRIEQIRSQLTLEQNVGMLDLDQSLARLVLDGLVDPAEARARARVPEEFERAIRRPRGSSMQST
jgi:twitching motility protein PilT